ncbi:hypothetical protein DL766_008442 [Monosporascus sp. MC13-8B]|uniref:Antifungal protein n=1 Tax=Monosporascus cannonballus TaxID=155416 RepID=A0ABY0H9Z9_9PEZI|nr:hypothetical protein DL762_003784 [Monosporascus cannonballus]RYO93546.1 hypothetical protein DL763_004342 [Monosporascus cannonballus]RYP19432.1 hypothetical protein DL766_008442 [Monosporascus sp. MC13-8B]
MQLITLFVSSLAVFGIHAAIVPADAHNEPGAVFAKRDQGLCSYDGDCMVNGVRKTCQIGASDKEQTLIH